MPRINASLPSSPHRNRTPTLFDCCVMCGWHWYMPICVSWSDMYSHTDVKNIRFVCKKWRGATKPSPTIAILAITASIGCRYTGDYMVGGGGGHWNEYRRYVRWKIVYFDDRRWMTNRRRWVRSRTQPAPIIPIKSSQIPIAILAAIEAR